MTTGSSDAQEWLNLAELPRQVLEALTIARERDLERLGHKDRRDWSHTEHSTYSVVRTALEEIRTLLDAHTSGQADLPEVSNAEAAWQAHLAHVTMERDIAKRVGKLLREHGLTA